MTQRLTILTILTILAGLSPALAASLSAAEPGTAIPEQYRVEPMQWPDADRSGDVGQRLLRLLSIQVARELQWVQQERQASGIGDDQFIIRGAPAKNIVRIYDLYHTATLIYTFTVLAKCGEPGETMAGTTREHIERTVVTMIRAVIDSHPVGGGPNPHEDWWHKMWGMRIQHQIGMGAWLIWDLLDAQTQLRLAKVLEHDADIMLDNPAPALLRNDTQAESNAWNGGGMAVVACMFKHHPHSAAWADKAKELMLSAYATQKDVDSSRIVDGKPLNKWLTGPNALPDYTVENHGFIHPDYIAAASEMVRSAITYRLAGEPIPEAATFNADKTFDALLWMTMPAGHYLYAQGTDYCPKRLDSFLQACNVIPLKPNPLRNAWFLRSLTSIEKMAAERPGEPMCAWLGSPLDCGTIWGLTENYMMRRLFGSGGDTLPNDQVEQRMAGIRIFKEGMFAIHRTPRTISSFSWHTTARKSPPMGMTMPLEKDAILYPMPNSLIGELYETADTINSYPRERPEVRSHQVNEKDNSFSVVMELGRCSGKVTQNCAFVTLPDGSSVYLEERTANQAITLAKVTSGNVAISDDLRWVYQPKPRRFFGQAGGLTPTDATLYKTNWLNIDDRLGYVTLGNALLRLTKVAGEPGIFRKYGTMYDTCRMEYVQLPSGDEPNTAPAHFDAGQQIGTFALIALPNSKADETKSLADEISRAGWVADAAGCLALQTKTYLVYANFSVSGQRIAAAGAKELPARTCGWMMTGAPGRPTSW